MEINPHKVLFPSVSQIKHKIQKFNLIFVKKNIIKYIETLKMHIATLFISKQCRTQMYGNVSTVPYLYPSSVVPKCMAMYSPCGTQINYRIAELVWVLKY